MRLKVAANMAAVKRPREGGPAIYLLLADVLALLHGLIVLFVVGGQALILAGWWRDWTWTRVRWFRWGHLALIGFVVVQTWLGQLCPLTIWEHRLRQLAGEEGYTGSFVAHWLHKILYWQAPHWVFVAVYSVFGAAVVISFLYYPPRRR